MTTDDLNAFRDSARQLLTRSASRSRVRALRYAVPGFERSMWEEMAAAGWTALLVPEAEGGLGLGLAELAALAEEIGRQLAPEPFIGGAVHATAALNRLPDSALKSELLAALAAGERVIGLAWQARAGQVETDRFTITANVAGDGFELNGSALFVVPGEGADGWLVAAGADEQALLAWVPAAAAGIVCRAERRVDGGPMAMLELTRVAVARSQVLATGAAVRAALAAANDTARLAQSAELLGVARGALALTLDYLKTRVQFGKPIGAFQALQHRAVDAYLQTELAAATLQEVLAAAELQPAQAARAKARCAHAALFVTRLGVQFHGAMGFTDECDIGLYLKRALQLSSWLGNAPASRQRYFALRSRVAATQDTETVVDFPRDADWEAMPEAEFRRGVRDFFRRNYPDELRFMPRRLRLAESRGWMRTLDAQGWMAPSWPKRFGGMGLPADKLLAFIEEGERQGVCRFPDMGIIMVGPILQRFGSAEQQDFYLPRILSGEHIWCQGYSEPNAGSDLASLRTEAVIDGDDFIVNGQKIWTTWGHDATHIFMLVRTDKTVKKQQGISFLLIDLAAPGITVRPIVDIAGNEEFCEVFFENVRVPRANLVGELNQGWTIAKALLGFERIFVGSPKQSQHALEQLNALAQARGLFDDPVFAARYAELELDVADLGALYGRYAAMMKRGEELPPDVSMLKIWATETYARLSMLLVEAADEYGGSRDAVLLDGRSINVVAPLFVSTSSTIYGGSSEIQRNILARGVLGLPD